MPEFEKQKNPNRSGFLARSAGWDRSMPKPVHDNNPRLAQHQALGNQAMLRFAQSCPLRLTSASLCPTGGACHACPVRVQTKLKIGQPGDKYEQEADRVADQVMRMPEPRLQRQLEPEEEEEEELLQAKEISGQTSEVNSGIEANINGVRSGGQPLPESVRNYFEPRFGYDFSQVRINTDARSAELARLVKARAFTVGRDVVFGEGQFALAKPGGKKLIAHELTHVMQQSRRSIEGNKRARDATHHARTVVAKPTTQAGMAGTRVSVQSVIPAGSLARAKDDLVAYSGGTSGILNVFQSKSLIFSTRAISGHPNSREHERNFGPIPTGTYALHPEKTRRTVTRLQSGTCGANAIASGYQEITSTDQSPCSDPPSHYCTVACPTGANPARKCFTPRDCWGEKRMKIEGAVRVPKPTGGTVTRSGFYIHGGNHGVNVTSGCVKVFDNATFTNIRKLKGSVPFCVGSACDLWARFVFTGQALLKVLSDVF